MTLAEAMLVAVATVVLKAAAMAVVWMAVADSATAAVD